MTYLEEEKRLVQCYRFYARLSILQAEYIVWVNGNQGRSR